MPSFVLLVDAFPSVYRVWNSPQRKFTTQSGEPTGLRYGFLRAVNSYRKIVAAKGKVEKVVICWDTMAPLKKVQLLQRLDYKSNRQITADKKEMYAGVPAVKDMVDLTSWTQVESDGYEADDLIGALLKKKSPDQIVVMVTMDRDMDQYVATDVLKLVPGEKELKGVKHVQETWGVPPKSLLLYRSIIGDISDSVSGVKLSTTQRLELARFFHEQGIEDVATLRQGLGWMRKRLTPNLVLTVEDNLSRIESNFELMKGHIPEQIYVRKGKADKMELLRLFEKLEMRSLMSKVEEFVL